MNDNNFFWGDGVSREALLVNVSRDECDKSNRSAWSFSYPDGYNVTDAPQNACLPRKICRASMEAINGFFLMPENTEGIHVFRESMSRRKTKYFLDGIKSCWTLLDNAIDGISPCHLKPALQSRSND